MRCPNLFLFSIKPNSVTKLFIDTLEVIECESKVFKLLSREKSYFKLIFSNKLLFIEPKIFELFGLWSIFWNLFFKGIS